MRLIKGYETGVRGRPKGIVDLAAYVGVRLCKRSPEDLRGVLDDGFADIEKSMNGGKIIIKSIVTAAPLAGLLGTVTGMIETFDSLADMSLHSSSGGIAGGISQALFTTQMGLSVAVPGVVTSVLLDRKQQSLSSELDKIKDILCHKYQRYDAVAVEDAAR